MSVDFTKLSYSSIYGFTRVIPRYGTTTDSSSQTQTISGTIAAFSDLNFDFYFEYGIPYNPATPGQPDANGITQSTTIPDASIVAYINSTTSPNNSSRWYRVGANPRPIIIGSSGGDLNTNVTVFRNTSTNSAPTLFIVRCLVINPYGSTVTITPNNVTVLAYGLSST